MKLTPKQKAFADYYIECGNAAEAARRAGYSKKTAEVIGRENLRKPTISAYIAEVIRPTKEKRIADATEVLEFFTDVMRGKVKDQFGLDSSLSDRLNAGKELMKRHDAGKLLTEEKKREDDPVTKALKEMAKELENGNFR